MVLHPVGARPVRLDEGNQRGAARGDPQRRCSDPEADGPGPFPRPETDRGSRQAKHQQIEPCRRERESRGLGVTSQHRQEHDHRQLHEPDRVLPPVQPIGGQQEPGHQPEDRALGRLGEHDRGCREHVHHAGHETTAAANRELTSEGVGAEARHQQLENHDQPPGELQRQDQREPRQREEQRGLHVAQQHRSRVAVRIPERDVPRVHLLASEYEQRIERVGCVALGAASQGLDPGRLVVVPGNLAEQDVTLRELAPIEDGDEVEAENRPEEERRCDVLVPVKPIGQASSPIG